MARVTVEDCLEREENRFALVILAARRTRQLMKGAPALVHSTNKAAVTAKTRIARIGRPPLKGVSQFGEGPRHDTWTQGLRPRPAGISARRR